MVVKNLRWIIQQEGKYQKWEEVPENVREEAQRLGYCDGMRLVLEEYKPGCRCRQVDASGINLGAGSLQFFRSFIKACEAAANETADTVIRALLWHNAGSASAKHNGNTGLQVDFNRRAFAILSGVPEAKRDDDWWAVYEKVAVGLYESNAITFDEADYRRIVVSMTGRTKDDAGRRDFLAKWLESQGRNQEAAEVLERVKVDTTSDPTQVARALETLKRLTSLLTAIFLVFAPIIMPRIAIAFC